MIQNLNRKCVCVCVGRFFETVEFIKRDLVPRVIFLLCTLIIYSGLPQKDIQPLVQ